MEQSSVSDAPGHFLPPLKLRPVPRPATSDRGGAFFDGNDRSSSRLRNDSREPPVAIDEDVDKSGQAAADCASLSLPGCVMPEAAVFQPYEGCSNLLRWLLDAWALVRTE
jgi:hypothetical protein